MEEDKRIINQCVLLLMYMLLCKSKWDIEEKQIRF